MAEPQFELSDLLESKPTSRRRLEAAWDGLNTETQMHLLRRALSLHESYEYREREALLGPPIKLIDQAMASPNAYVRTLAWQLAQRSGVERHAEATKGDEENEWTAALARAKSDKSPLVRFANDSLALKSAESFLESPQDTRLEALRLLGYSEARNFIRAMCLLLAESAPTPRPTMSDEDMSELVIEFFSSEQRDSDYAEKVSVFGDMSFSDQMGALWEISLSAPPKTQQALLTLTPGEVRSGGWGALKQCIPDKVADALADRGLLHQVLMRKDLGCTALRSRIFLSDDPRFQSDTKSAALQYRFALTDAEFHSLLKSDSPLLDELGWASDCLPLPQLLALNEWLDKQPHPKSRKYPELRRDEVVARIEALKRKDAVYMADEAEAELRDYGIYRIARRVLYDNARDPSEHYLPKPLRWLLKHVVPGDTWATYMAFKEAWRNAEWEPEDVDFWLDKPEGWLVSEYEVVSNKRRRSQAEKEAEWRSQYPEAQSEEHANRLEDSEETRWTLFILAIIMLPGLVVTWLIFNALRLYRIATSGNPMQMGWQYLSEIFPRMLGAFGIVLALGVVWYFIAMHRSTLDRRHARLLETTEDLQQQLDGIARHLGIGPKRTSED